MRDALQPDFVSTFQNPHPLQAYFFSLPFFIISKRRLALFVFAKRSKTCVPFNVHLNQGFLHQIYSHLVKQIYVKVHRTVLNAPSQAANYLLIIIFDKIIFE